MFYMSSLSNMVMMRKCQSPLTARVVVEGGKEIAVADAIMLAFLVTMVMLRKRELSQSPFSSCVYECCEKFQMPKLFLSSFVNIICWMLGAFLNPFEVVLYVEDQEETFNLTFESFDSNWQQHFALLERIHFLTFNS